MVQTFASFIIITSLNLLQGLNLRYSLPSPGISTFNTRGRYFSNFHSTQLDLTLELQDTLVRGGFQKKGESMVCHPPPRMIFFPNYPQKRPLMGEINFTLGSNPKFNFSDL